MTSLSEYIAEGFREVQSQQVIDLDKVGSVKPQNIPAALPSMYAFLYKLSDYYNGPTEYYADDETLDFYEKYFEKNPDYKFIVPGVEEDGIGIDFYVKTLTEKISFKILLTSDEVRAEDHACIIPYKEDGRVKLLANEHLDYLIWKVPNRNDFFLFKRKELFEFLERAGDQDNLVRIQKVKGKKDTSVFRLSKSALNRICTQEKDVVTKGTFRSKDVYVGKDLEDYLEELKKNVLRR
jgi:hypothetical protein